MKKISVLIPTYNEEGNVPALYSALKKIFSEALKNYEYEVVFIDNSSTDKTRELLEGICHEDKHIKAIFNVRNFGSFNSPYYGLQQCSGDAVILYLADFQDPIDLIPTFVHEWENGYKVVIGIKTSSKENRFMYSLRTLYYKTIKKFSKVEQIEHFTGFGLYDKSFIEIMRQLDDPSPFLRGVVAEFGFPRKEIPYEQQKRRCGKSGNSWYDLYDAAMLSVTSYTKIGLRLATFAGALVGCVSFFIALFYLVYKLLYWDRFPAGMAPMLVGILFIGAVQLFFIGLIGEYLLSINTRIMKRPLVIEEKRINFDDGEPK